MLDNLDKRYLRDAPDADRPEFGWREGAMAVVLLVGLACLVVGMAAFG